MARRIKPSRGRLIPLITLLVGVAVLLGGCYRHVVDVKGPGASRYDVYEPHFQPQEEEDIKSFFSNLFGGSADKKKK